MFLPCADIGTLNKYTWLYKVAEIPVNIQELGYKDKNFVTSIAHTEVEIIEIIWSGIFCAHKPYFVMPGHIYTYGTYVIHLVLVY